MNCFQSWFLFLHKIWLVSSYYCDYFYFPRNIKAFLWWEGVDPDVMSFLCVNKAFRFSSGVKCAFYSSLGQLEIAISPMRPIGFKVTKELVVSASCFSSQTTAAKSSVTEVTLCQNYWVSSRAWELQLRSPRATTTVKPECLEPGFQKKSHCNEEYPLLTATRESPCSNRDPTQPKFKKKGIFEETVVIT